MKKTLIAVLLVLAFSVVSVFALDGIGFYTGIGFDARNVKDLGNRTRSLDLEVGAKYPTGDGFYVYTDAGFRFAGKGTVSGAEMAKGLFGANIRAGVLYGMRFVNKPQIEAYFGGGATFAFTSFSAQQRYFTNIGLGLKADVAYRFNSAFALALQFTPDFYFLNSGKFSLGFGSTTSIGAMFKF